LRVPLFRDRPVCAFATSQQLTLASCLSDAAFAKDCASWTWRGGVKAAMGYGDFEWDDAVQTAHYDPIQTPKLLVRLGTSPRSTLAQKCVGRTFALRIVSCARIAEMTSNIFGGGDTLYEHQLYGWPAGVYVAQSPKLPAQDRTAVQERSSRLALRPATCVQVRVLLLLSPT